MNVLSSLDASLFFAVNNGLSTPWLDGVMTFFTVAGDFAGWALFGALFILLWDTPNAKRRLLAFAAALALSGGTVNLIKEVVARDRPLEAFKQGIDAGTVTIHTPYHELVARSFPSGHTQAAFTAALFFVLYYRHRGWGALLLTTASLVGFSRIYVGAHYPADVAAGALLGAAGAWLVWRLDREAPFKPAPGDAR
ncbi:MAG: phosphatase PAP2 family protein [Nitrospinae bacterium]|nr:phosphatase PAP2 family protein [Nitrospinota bacterium]